MCIRDRSRATAIFSFPVNSDSVTTFWVDFPLGEGPAFTEVVSERTEMLSGTETILVVEDEDVYKRQQCVPGGAATHRRALADWPQFRSIYPRLLVKHAFTGPSWSPSHQFVIRPKELRSTSSYVFPISNTFSIFD